MRQIRRPLIGVVLFYILGVWFGHKLEADFLRTILAACFCCAVSAALAVFHRRSKDGRFPAVEALSTVTMLLGVTFAAWSWVTLGRVGAVEQEFAALSQTNETKVELIGIVAFEPDVSVQPSRRVLRRFPLRVEWIRRSADTDWRYTRGVAWVSWRSPEWSRPPQYGEEWLIPAVVTDTSRPDSGRQSAVGKWRYRVNASWHEARRLSSGHGNPLMVRCIEARRASATLLARGIEDYGSVVAVLHALLLGYGQELPKYLHSVFVYTGTLHIFAISGSHIVLMAGMLIVLLQIFRISRVYWFLFLGPIMILYTMLTGLQTSAIRACIMGLAFWAAPILSRKSDAGTSLAFSALLILIVAPVELFDVGLILSFGAVIGLVVLCAPIARWIEKWWAPDPLRLQPEAPFIQALRVAWRSFAYLVAASCAAWLATTPVMAYSFNQFSLVALLANLFVIPMAFLVMLAGCLSIVCGSCVAVCAEIFNHANVVLISALTGFMGLLARVPGGYMKVERPPAWLVILWYSVLALAAFMVYSLSAKREDTVTAEPE